MRAHYLQHVPFEGLGSIKPWLEEEGYEITSSKFFKSQLLPDPKLIDLLIVMGVPMSVNDKERYSWIVPEIGFINEVIQLGKPVLGICLGAQLISSAMGAEIYQNSEKEIGWFKVAKTKHSSLANPLSDCNFIWKQPRNQPWRSLLIVVMNCSQQNMYKQNQKFYQPSLKHTMQLTGL
jgi:GMP synthase-like glutamine amidotransferase